MSVKITDNTKVLIVNEQRASALSLRLMTDAVTNASRPKTPLGQTSSLRNNVLKQVLGLHATILWAVQYAQYQDRGARKDGSHVVKNYTTSGTGAGFAESAIEEIVQNAEAYFRQGQLI